MTIVLQSQLTLMVVRQGRGLATVSSPTYRYCVDISRYLFISRDIYLDIYSTPHRGSVPHLLLDVELRGELRHAGRRGVQVLALHPQPVIYLHTEEILAGGLS